MSQSDLNTVTYEVEKDERGRLITSHSDSRATVNRNHWDEFQTVLGSEEKANHRVENFRRFSTAGDRDSIMADGIVCPPSNTGQRNVTLQTESRRSYQEHCLQASQ